MVLGLRSSPQGTSLTGPFNWSNQSAKEHYRWQSLRSLHSSISCLDLICVNTLRVGEPLAHFTLSRISCLPISPLDTNATSTAYFFCHDIWNDNVPKLNFPKFFSLARNGNISIRKALDSPWLSDNFHLPLTVQAHQQFPALSILL